MTACKAVYPTASAPYLRAMAKCFVARKEAMGDKAPDAGLLVADCNDEVTIKMKHADYWLIGELASIPGMIVEKQFTLAQGSNYGTPAGKIMGTGSYKFQSFTPGVAVVVVRNDSYWDSSVKPLVREIDIKGASNDASLTSALETGGINGVFAQGLTTLGYRVRGEVTFKGATRAYEEEMALTQDGTDQLRLTGESTFDIRDFGMDPPRILMLKVEPEVGVRVEIVAEREG